MRNRDEGLDQPNVVSALLPFGQVALDRLPPSPAQDSREIRHQAKLF
jgi:hypothetical protein